MNKCLKFLAILKFKFLTTLSYEIRKNSCLGLFILHVLFTESRTAIVCKYALN